ncbi:MAG: 2OG-Fe(II) oxygenase [Chitinophagaceae bacterium]
MISITRKGLQGLNDAVADQLKQEFEQKHSIFLPQLVEESILQKIIRDIESASFYENEHTSKDKVFATDLSIQSKNIALHQIRFVLNNPQLFQLIEHISGCLPIKGFACRIYKNLPGAGHHLDWHDDTSVPSRLVGLSINLGREKYSGGVFQLREKGKEELLREVRCGNPGDTHIFRVSSDLEHRVTQTTGEHPRIASAGWFFSEDPSPWYK